MIRGHAWAKRAVASAIILLGFGPTARAEGDDNASYAISNGAIELTRQGREHANHGDDAIAMRRFADALRLDPSYGPAYLELGGARERAGDWREAERTYDVAIEHVPNFVGALRARAALLHRLGESARELSDLELLARLTEGPDTLRALGTRYIEARAWPAALTTFRRLFLFAERTADEALTRDARAQVRALAVLCSEMDPVLAGAADRAWERRALAAIAKRRGM